MCSQNEKEEVLSNYNHKAADGFVDGLVFGESSVLCLVKMLVPTKGVCNLQSVNSIGKPSKRVRPTLILSQETKLKKKMTMLNFMHCSDILAV